MITAILLCLALVAAVAAVATGAWLAWLVSGPLGTLPLRVLWARLRSPHRHRQRHELLTIHYTPTDREG